MAKKTKQSITSRETYSLEGIPASPGVVVGKVELIQDLYPAVEEKRLPAKAVLSEVERFKRALKAAEREVRALKTATFESLGEDEARIFDVQLMMLQDPLIIARTLDAIQSEQKNADFLFSHFLAEVAERLEASPEAHFKERAVDLYDVKRRVLQHLAGKELKAKSKRPGVLLGREITPSDAVHLDPGKILGFVTELGGVTSHASIMARARGIPAVVGLRSLLDRIQEGDMIALDGINGQVIVNPTEDDVRYFRKRRQAFHRWRRARVKTATQEARTQDGRQVFMAANMELPEEWEFIKSRGADGVGLFRTEFFFMRNHRTPTEEEQYQVYSELARDLAGQDLTIRVLDVGGDKFASYLGFARERNPYLGMRGIRYLLEHPAVFRTQLRALLRAGAIAPLKILLPMVHSVAEIERSRVILEEVLQELAAERLPHDEDPKLGMMIEVPSAVVQIYDFTRHVDFFSIGSNDLIQYMLAIDRDHEVLKDLYDPLHPAVLRVIDWVVRAARRAGTPVTLCGEMASDARSLPLLIGLGIKHLSVSPFLLPELKAIVRELRYDTCLRMAQEAKTMVRARDIENLVQQTMGDEYAKWFSWSERNGADGNGNLHG